MFSFLMKFFGGVFLFLLVYAFVQWALSAVGIPLGFKIFGIYFSIPFLSAFYAVYSAVTD